MMPAAVASLRMEYRDEATADFTRDGLQPAEGPTGGASRTYSV